MLKLISLASGSLGNCQILHDDTQVLICDAGISDALVMKVLREHNLLDHRISLLITHSHGDHVKYLPELDRCLPLVPCKGNITSFPVHHDVDTLGYIVDTGTEKVLGLTDFNGVETTPFVRQHFDLVMIECNYNKSIDALSLYVGLKPRHASIGLAQHILSQISYDKLHLLHLSEKNICIPDFTSFGNKHSSDKSYTYNLNGVVKPIVREINYSSADKLQERMKMMSKRWEK